ncbi:hypothetical protein ONS95_009133 [Cadophora gregata]|uniref:uncharacterized protein n=1 Tax=Cadophora gregata TaxID=51156 RepID=UPI0026DCFD6C|nr:uncharacterized protein ONS95_009133 [Cadophora gregata]KAK0124150.1 hypothetical protein ONS95_009133 [Cadophora gregata]KAK0130480.1 hypothetical protein ONS96_000999 [Cadophora gregata f. sp. sojae]
MAAVTVLGAVCLMTVVVTISNGSRQDSVRSERRLSDSTRHHSNPFGSNFGIRNWQKILHWHEGLSFDVAIHIITRDETFARSEDSCYYLAFISNAIQTMPE